MHADKTRHEHCPPRAVQRKMHTAADVTCVKLQLGKRDGGREGEEEEDKVLISRSNPESRLSSADHHLPSLTAGRPD